MSVTDLVVGLSANKTGVFACPPDWVLNLTLTMSRSPGSSGAASVTVIPTAPGTDVLVVIIQSRASGPHVTTGALRIGLSKVRLKLIVRSLPTAVNMIGTVT